ncbi:GGDEF domain-containing protein [Oceanirhabdus sp. W0125-5]|uniref:GGDEF domain-containing protein n=1 Tax=Oceanirhabdus sp. W0125-5 TaxID=2999116 RepID=UPI0022F2A643|nr:GGDEF domain-containing protein [Oceanirhabdus sp. W0125-5]WBW98446.1 GGDEF domain-containing protein [Oceanirhabdus sp. W0125-5]
MELRESNNILEKFKSLFITLSKEYKNDFYNTIARENLGRIIIMSIIYSLFEIMVILTKKEIDITHQIKFSIGIMMFHIIVILASFWLIFIKSKINGKRLQIIIALYCIILIYWSVNVSLEQVGRTGSITMFILTLTGTSALFYRRSLITLITNFGFYIYFVLNMKLLRASSFVTNLNSSQIGHQSMERFSQGTYPGNNFPIGKSSVGKQIISMFTTDHNIYLVDAFLMTVISCVLGIIIYRLRLKVFLEKRALVELSMKDSMTNLFNHENICNILKKEIKVSKESSQQLSILMTDIDHFKKINDTYGHQVGDQVIIKIAKLLRESCRETDYVGRYGGEEFLVVLTNTNKEQVKKFAERFRKEIEEIDFGLTSQVTVSGGVKTYEKESAEEMIKMADDALYQAKEKGRNCIVSA